MSSRSRESARFPRPSWRKKIGDLGNCAALDGHPETLGAVARSFERILLGRGYVTGSYYRAPHGFLYLTQMERIDDEGRPLPGDERWRGAGVRPSPIASAGDFVRALIFGREGWYRVLAVSVSDDQQDFSSDFATAPDALSWGDGHQSQLFAELEGEPLGPRHVCAVMVYEFLRRGHDEVGMQQRPGLISLRQHLAGAGLSW